MEQGLFQNQRLQLVITNKMEQQLSLLHMPMVELERFLMDQALENPLIDMESFDNNHLILKKHQNDKNSEKDWLNNIEQPRNLYDFLLEQLSFLTLKPKEQEIMEYLIFLVDENGYFQGDLQDVSKHFAVPVDLVEQALYRLQTFEPIGVGARTLQECILLQIRDVSNHNELAELVVAHYFELLVERKWREISNKMGVDITEIQNVFDLLKNLNPRPASSYQNDYPQLIKPELIISEDRQGFIVKINNALYPKLSCDSYYNERMDQLSKYDQSNYLTEKYEHLNWLKKSIEKRKTTLVRVMQAIIDKQNDFFQKGTSYLKPLTIKEIAELVELHESTVSRAVNGKYVQTPHGLFELKYFFTSSISTNGNDEISSEIVKDLIVEIVKNENKSKPLSDQKILDILSANEGLTLTRRTVTKYREQLGVPSSSKRKRY
ncbi:RNA polymerase factor sigma-54 [Schinkia azotoformans]|uniref:RNA polymerase factor sigma-54 n=1 Tax=Schinkia azotoformans LMG 9581 TaxID=1131731 RepID=K6E3Y7_SCHAZ|nr:RNA polymerase factor sigma-54 [Schinkia azotoformans]EKN67951.1 RNA polymerase factor sigma-54 [Schinkia azotoformans LMG 9581]MEC1637029.1 RNA polymerase factor sigma-54 [Schinkia azotoformans]MEC1722151.1 RNA polymerase factor sigma-54 [Schinkia azotoformans]MEC1947005.1 RNA polymerase factor sigma-54 [Schinkia azotoformans]MED4351370.1 RNA polymerase factor sigma-54 [Schinkia azotoformans]